jgi:hypothetical protein
MYLKQPKSLPQHQPTLTQATDRARKEDHMVSPLESWVADRPVKTIIFYKPAAGEPDLSQIMTRMPHLEFAIPVVTDGKILEFFPVTCDTNYELNSFGLYQPVVGPDSLTAPAEGDFQVTARYTSGNDMLTAGRYFVVDAGGQGDWEQVRPLFEKCQFCHNQVAPDLGSLQSVTANRMNVLESIQSGLMPPNGMLSQQEKQQMVSFLEGLSGGGGSSGSSDLEIKQTREDDRHIVKVDQIKNGNVVRSETFDSPGAGKKLILPDFCSQNSTCLKVTFIGGITQEAGNAQCVFVSQQSANTVKVDVDTNGAGFLGVCKPDEDETYYFSCPNSPGNLKVAGCSN